MNNNLLLVLARHKNGEKVYLFESEVAISVGEKIIVDTIRGKCEAIAVADSFSVTKEVVNFIALALGAYFPLKKVLGIVEVEIIQQERIVWVNEIC